MSKLILLVSLLLSSISVIAQDDIYLVVVKKAEQKKQSRWSLTEWMTTKKKMDTMDRWLALNSDWPASIFEGYLEGNYTSDIKFAENGVGQSTGLVGGKMGLFLAFLGVEGGVEKSGLESSYGEGQVTLRILGNYEQSNNFSIGYGARKSAFKVKDSTFEENFTNEYAMARLNLMLASFLGVRGEYRAFIKSKTDTTKKEVDGTLVEGTAYFDLNFLNLGATYFKEKFKVGDTKLIREGVRFFARLYF
ncbi:MAG: hypothetical protein KAG61_01075 [Bacteriovoracaceae bacterium]|nr:hypothetical protein [Bacteriovoracaceae bacterium]